MTIVESLIIGKRNPETCEDGIVVTDDFVAVIDGSTSKTNMQIDSSMKNGQFCMKCIAQYVSSLSPSASLSDFCDGITKKIRDIYNTHNLDIALLQANPIERLTASAVIYSRHRHEIWMVGDCQCLVDNVFYENPKPSEAIVADHRSQIISKLLKDHTCSIEDLQRHDIGREAVISEIIDGCRYQNIRYAVIDGFPIPQDKIKVICTTDAKEIVLASDGYPVLRNTLEKSEQDLSLILTADPLLITQHKATKGLYMGNVSFDDRTYVRFTPTSVLPE